MMTDAVSYHCENGCASITIDDGKVNVMSGAVLDRLCAAVARARDDNALIILQSGREKVFSAGFDMKPLSGGDIEAIRALLEAGVRASHALLQRSDDHTSAPQSLMLHPYAG